MKKNYMRVSLIALVAVLSSVQLSAQMGTRFPSERKVIKDPVTGTELIFLTHKDGSGDHKTYQTHSQWTADGKWHIFRSDRVPGEAMAVNIETGDLVQVTEGGYNGMMNISRKDMILYISRPHLDKKQAKQLAKYNKEMEEIREQMQAQMQQGQPRPQGQPGQPAPQGQQAQPRQQMQPMQMPQPKTPRPVYANEYVAIDLAKLFADSEAGKMKKASEYETILGVTPLEWGGGELAALDGKDEKYAYFLVGQEYAKTQVPADMKVESGYGERGMGAGPSGMAYMDLTTGECHYIRTIPFKVGHIQGNPWHNDEVIFCWETGGKAPTRIWAMDRDGSNYRPLYREHETDWITHEVVINEDEIAFAVLGHRPIQEDRTAPVDGWGFSGTREYATGLAVVNMRTRKFEMAGQGLDGNNIWHVAGSADGNWVAGDDFNRNLWLIDRHTHEVILLTTGHKLTASDHVHPTFSPDGKSIHIQSAMLSDDGKTLGMCIVKIPENLLNRYNK